MGTHGVEIFAKPVSTDLSDDPLVATHISNRILKAAENSQAATKSGPAEATEANKAPFIEVAGDKDDLLHNEISNPVVRVILTAYRSDYFPILLLLAGYTLFAFGAALILLLWLIAHRA
ncbi:MULTISPECIES: hypothetical protein [unclassified Mesorhizobium]|uniref:hypothetical protein n=1 Tax=unclassified Mesorhizobium TaxID=325217 RepID=UPI000BAEECFE|nr:MULTISPECIES: hypothetical protein [unclassified Mesorhizobium]PBB23917.1 hypothetical protein CK232_24285 [Mesorhizobium sp. WSM4304]PBB72922.1 hypothetical protein CK227_25080 [Mesorhizobium sp. WSM4308]